jgi:hypothetical protein
VLRAVVGASLCAVIVAALTVEHEVPGALAQVGDTTTTTLAPTPTTEPFSTTTTVASPTTTSPARPGTTTSTTQPPPPGPIDEFGKPVDPRAIPPEARALIASVRRSRPNSTDRILAALAPLTGYGFTAEEAAIAGVGHFPVAGPAHFIDDWWFPRFTPTFHLHEGTDVFAAFGTPVRAPYSGVLTASDGPVGGIGADLTLNDRSVLYFAHLQSRVPRPNGARVRQGDIIGYVGDTGDAKGGAPHLHFEVRPKGGANVDPKPYLDLWLKEAEAFAPGLVARFAQQQPHVVTSTGRTRGLEAGSFSAPLGPPGEDVLWLASVSPSGGLEYAVHEAVRLAAGVDWSAARHKHQSR